MRVIAASLLSLIATILGVIVLVLTWVLTTESGLRFAVQELHAQAPGRFTVGAVNGRLIGPLTIRNLDLKTATSHLTADYVNFDWLPSRLFLGEVVIDRLHVRGASLTSYETNQKSTSTPAELLALLQPPPAIELHDIVLQDFEYRTPGSKPFIIRHAELAAGSDSRGLHLDKLQAEGPLFAIQGHALIKPQRGHPTQGELSWQVRPPGYPTAVGHTTLSGSLQELHIEQRIDAPYRTQATAVVHDVLTDPHFQAEVHLNALRLRAIRAQLPNLTIDATAHAKGRSSDIDYTAQAKIVDPAQGTFKLSLDGGLAQQIVNIHRLALVVMDTPIRMQADGRINLASKHSALAADWQKLRWPLQGTPRFTSPSGRLTLSGTPDNLTARLNAAIGDKGAVIGHMRREQDNIQLALDWHDLNWPLHQPRVSSPEGTARLAGTLQRYTLAVDTRIDMP
ncbi:MAG TPA: hypothetical protein VFL97_10660, partial [Nitrococcus sp.]|nr:hypothetical protein [Nitrococcus sp.]